MWDDECDEAFRRLKEYLTCPSISSRSLQYIYLASSDHARSAVLLRKDHLEEMPVYCVSMLMTIVEQRYNRLQVIRLALITAARRLNLILWLILLLYYLTIYHMKELL